jgi:hypothetical protein
MGLLQNINKIIEYYLKFIRFVVKRDIFFFISVFFILYLLIVLCLAPVYFTKAVIAIRVSQDQVCRYDNRVFLFKKDYLNNKFINFIIID